jgi:hypothetical protein
VAELQQDLSRAAASQAQGLENSAISQQAHLQALENALVNQRAKLHIGIIGLPIMDDVPKQRILLMNLYLNQILNTLLLNNTLKKKHEKSSTSKFVNLTIISKYKNTNADYIFSLPNFPVPPKYDEKYSKIILKVNSLLDEKKLISPVCPDNDDEVYANYSSAAAGGGKNENKNKYNHSKNLIRRRKQKTIKKKIRNLKNKKSLKSKIKNKINKKIKKCVKKCVKKCMKQQEQTKQQKQQKQQQENKYKIKKILESKIHQKINKLKSNKTKNFNKNKSYHSREKYTRKNY